ncbi:hypothetical protein TNIN_269451 [Trichonephila inaurata madagascariensis]|uniref:Uncharacterized protein n=1 Tax=Trichonephila inaurata madagascariensis TaxID=2747483 RepID=A0A8X6X4Z6_9ARAC|nr:hypothetical protein TNIN_269451 [Trichonephila inaurata madagascariensis]
MDDAAISVHDKVDTIDSTPDSKFTKRRMEVQRVGGPSLLKSILGMLLIKLKIFLVEKKHNTVENLFVNFLYKKDVNINFYSEVNMSARSIFFITDFMLRFFLIIFSLFASSCLIFRKNKALGCLQFDVFALMNVNINPFTEVSKSAKPIFFISEFKLRFSLSHL